MRMTGLSHVAQESKYRALCSPPTLRSQSCSCSLRYRQVRPSASMRLPPRLRFLVPSLTQLLTTSSYMKRQDSPAPRSSFQRKMGTISELGRHASLPSPSDPARPLP
jgi:hypothetical protein